MNFINHKIPEHIKKVIKEIEIHGFKAYLVGGAVRDLILGKSPKDYDIATSATPDDLYSIFSKIIPTGEKYGTVTVVDGNNFIEVTTLRTDGSYTDSRRPDDVYYTDRVFDDLSRRDFTINALAWSNKHGVIDYFDGLADIRNKTLKSVGNPYDRFREDPLRMLRGVRLIVQLDLKKIDPLLLKTINNNGEWLGKVSAERVRNELNSILLSDFPGYGITFLVENNLMKYIIPEVLDMVGFDQMSKYHNKDIFNHTMSALKFSDNDLDLRLAILFHDIGKPYSFKIIDGRGTFYGHHKVSAVIAEDVMHRLKYDNYRIDRVNRLVKNHMYNRFNAKRISNRIVCRLINRVGKDNLDLFFKMVRGDIMASAPPHDFSELDSLRDAVNKYIEEEKPMSVKDLMISGKDLMEMGLKEGPIIGDTLEYLLDLVVENPDVNDRDTLLMFSRGYINVRFTGI